MKSMLIKEISGNTRDLVQNTKKIELIDFEWFELFKRIVHKKSSDHQEFAIKLLMEGQYLNSGDIIFQNEDKLYVVNVLPTLCLKVSPRSSLEMATVCYEIGNKHLPLFYEGDSLLVAHERPLEQLLVSGGYQVESIDAKLIDRIKIRGAIPTHGHGNQSLFSKLMEKL